MNDNKKTVVSVTDLRNRAEEQVASQAVATKTVSKRHDTQRLLHELQVHQVELEMQNEELRSANAKMAEHEVHLQNIIKLTPAGYFHIDLKGRFLEVNDAWLRMHGYDSQDDVIGKSFNIMQVDCGSDSALAHFAELQRGIAIPAGEFASRRKDGSVGYHIFSATPVVKYEKVVGYEWFIIDISDRKRVEEEKLLIQQQLRETQKLESLGVLSGGIAHDFNNILAIIMGYCSLTKMDYELAEKHVPEIEKAANRAAELCRQMLAYAGKAQIVNSTFDFVDLVFETVKMLKASLPQNAVIKLESLAKLPFVLGDISQIRQVAMNLIINASEAIGESQGEVSVSIAKTAISDVEPVIDYNGKIISPGWYICLKVTDNGCGMDNETKQRIFEPFYTTKFTGRGLGMSAVLGIIMSHGGALQLFSELGHGTTFKVYLPIPNSELAVDKSTQQDSSEPWQGSGTILLVEDEEMLMTMVKVLLNKLGFSVIEASNGKEALELYQKNSDDITLVVTDMGMPVMNGYELFRELKKLKPELPIIISSGFGDADVTSKIAREDIAGLISKPYSFDQLREVVKGVIENMY